MVLRLAAPVCRHLAAAVRAPLRPLAPTGGHTMVSSSSSAGGGTAGPVDAESGGRAGGKWQGSGPLALSFSGCGFLGVYHFGAAACLCQHADATVLSRCDRYAGASVGSLLAAVLAVCPSRLPAALSVFYDTADSVWRQPLGALTAGYSLIGHLRSIADAFMPQDAHRLANGRLFVSVTRVSDRRNRLVSHWESREELLDTLMASCFIPIYAGAGEKPILLGGEAYIDGGFTRNLPRFDAAADGGDSGASTPDGDRARTAWQLVQSVLPSPLRSSHSPKDGPSAPPSGLPTPDAEPAAAVAGGAAEAECDEPPMPTITVSPFSGEADVSPCDAPPDRVARPAAAAFDWTITLGDQSLKVNMRNVVRGARAMFPPRGDLMRTYFAMGYKDCMRWLIANQLLERHGGTAV